MQIPQKQTGNVLVASLSGRLDSETADEFKKALEPIVLTSITTKKKLLLDLAGIEYVSSAGLRVLMLLFKQAGKQSGEVALAAAQPFVAEVLEISRLDTVFKIFPTVAEALSKL